MNEADIWRDLRVESKTNRLKKQFLCCFFDFGLHL